jgi:large subunit ribosomal protein L4
LNKKVRKAALCSALSRRCSESRIVILDAIDFAAPKTKQVTELMKRFELTDMLLVAVGNENVTLSARNVPHVTVVPPEGVNVYDVLNRSVMLVTKDAAVALAARLGG